MHQEFNSLKKSMLLCQLSWIFSIVQIALPEVYFKRIVQKIFEHGHATPIKNVFRGMDFITVAHHPSNIALLAYQDINRNVFVARATCHEREKNSLYFMVGSYYAIYDNHRALWMYTVISFFFRSFFFVKKKCRFSKLLIWMN